MLPELIIFDLAGTTVQDHKEVHRVLQQAFIKEGISISIEEANQVMGIPKPVAIKQLLLNRGFENISIGWIDHIHNNFVDEMVRYYKESSEVAEIEGVSDLFRSLKSNGIKVAVDTGFDRHITNAILDRLKWKENNLIDESVTSDEVTNGRPFPDMVFEAMKRSGVKDVKKVAKVGDTPYDLREGKNAGCTWNIGVTSGAFTFNELKDEPHTHLVTDVTELGQIFNTLVK